MTWKAWAKASSWLWLALIALTVNNCVAAGRESSYNMGYRDGMALQLQVNETSTGAQVILRHHYGGEGKGSMLFRGFRGQSPVDTQPAQD